MSSGNGVKVGCIAGELSVGERASWTSSSGVRARWRDSEARRGLAGGLNDDDAKLRRGAGGCLSCIAVELTRNIDRRLVDSVSV